MQEVLKFFRENPTFFLATVDGDQARVRPFGAIAEFEGRLYICTGNPKKVYEQMMKHPKVELCGCTPEAGYVRVTATVVRDPRAEAKQAMLDQNAILGSLYKVDDGIFEVFYLKDATADFCTMTGLDKTVTF